MKDVINVKVGNDPSETFTVHSSVIFKSSPFIKTAPKPEWSASSSSPGTVDLSDECPEIFGIYLNWLYFETLPTVVNQDRKDAPAEYETLSKCYVMGEKLMDIGFKNAVIDALFEARTIQPFQNPCNPGPDPIKLIYEGTPEGSPARRYFVDVWAMNATEKWTDLLDDMPSAFVIDLSKALVARKTKKTTMICSDYHES